MAYDLYLGSMRMPVTPEKIDMRISGRNQTITLIDDSEVNILKAAGLTEVSFALLIPQVKYPFARYDGADFIEASAYLTHLEELKANRQPFQFIVSRCLPSGRSLFDTNLTVALEDYSIREAAGEGFDLTVDVRLKQYRSYGTKTIDVPSLAPTAPVVVEETRSVVENSTKASSGGGSGKKGSKSSAKKSSSHSIAVNAALSLKEAEDLAEKVASVVGRKQTDVPKKTTTGSGGLIPVVTAAASSANKVTGKVAAVLKR